jgi:O-antigen/teichoic acid export membrane protein
MSGVPLESQAIAMPEGPGSTAMRGHSSGRGALIFWRQNHDILGNASSLLATTIVTSALGFAFWALAAHLFSQRAVGLGAAAVSAMTVLGTIGMLGLNTVLIGELPRRTSRAGLVSAALLAAGFGSFVLGLGFALIAPLLDKRFAEISGSPGQAALLTAGVVLIGVSLVFDQATIGLLRGGLQLWRNVIFAVAKLVLLPVTAIVLHDQAGVGIALSWVAGTAVSLLVVVLQLWLTGKPALPRPDWGVLRGLGRLTMTHNWLNLAISVPWMLLPVLVTVTVSPSAAAAFYAAWTLSGFLRVVPTHLATVLFAVASGDPQVIARKLRLSLRISFLVGIPGIIGLIACAHLALTFFGASYAAAATIPLWLLALGYLPTIPKVHYIAVCRATGHIQRAALVLTLTATMEVAAAVAGALAGGLDGLSLALLAALMVEGLVTTPRVVRAARGRGRHRPAGSRGRHRLHIRSSLSIEAPGRTGGADRGAPEDQALPEEVRDAHAPH